MTSTPTGGEHLDFAEQLVTSAAEHMAMGRHEEARTAAAMAVPHFVAYAALKAVESTAVEYGEYGGVPYSRAMHLIGKARVGELYRDVVTGAAFIKSQGVNVHVTDEADALALAGLLRLTAGRWQVTRRGVETLNRGEI